MYSTEIKEFGVLDSFFARNGSVFYKNRYEIQNAAYKPLFFFKERPYTTEFAYDVYWVWYQNDDDTLYSHGLDCDHWNLCIEKPHPVGDNVVKLNDKWFVCGGDPTTISIYNTDSVKLKERTLDGNFYSSIFSHKNYLFVPKVSGGVYCYSLDLHDVWNTTSDKKAFALGSRITNPIFFEEMVILNLGEDNTIQRGNFEINAYEHNTGKLVWQVIVETLPNSSHLANGKLYVCVNNRFRRIDALTGNIEIDEIFDYKTFDGKPASIGAVYPLNEKTILCGSAESQILEVRTADAKSIIQTIQLPETYCYSGETLPVFVEDKIYLLLDHIVTIPFNLMKSGIAVLSPNANVSRNETAQLEKRVLYTVEPAKDDAGNNAHRIIIQGNDPDKIIHCAHLVLKEIAIKTGVAFGYEFEGLHDPLHAGKLFLEIDTSGLEPKETTNDEWLERFSIIKTRVDDELFTGRVAAGNKKNRYRVMLSII